METARGAPAGSPVISMTEREAWKLLAVVPKLGLRRRRELIEAEGGAAAAVEALLDGRGPCKQPWDLATWRAELERVLCRARRAGARALTPADGEYPEALRESSDPAAILHVRGDLSGLTDAPGVAVVGSRDCTPYGRRVAEGLGRDLARCGLPVISGLARGIDGAAHRGALVGGGVTLAVLPCGIDHVYPQRHRNLARRILERGALVTEFPPETAPEPYRFPVRNRLIAGLSLVTVVVEAAARSGAAITARLAMEEGREVVVVPGRIDSPTSRGALALLADGAHLCTGWEDIVVHLPPRAAEAARARRREEGEAPLPGLDRAQRTCLSALPPGRVCGLDSLVQRTSMELPEILAALTRLEVLGLIRVRGGNRYERTA